MKSTRKNRRRSKGVAVAAAAAMLLVACGESPTSSDGGTPPGGGGNGGSPDGGSPDGGDEGCDVSPRLAEINEELEGLEGDARRDRLIELSREEGGIVSFYGSTNPADSVPLIDTFQGDLGISVSHYRASASAVTQRFLEEYSANHHGVDVIVAGTNEFVLLEGEDVLASFESPIQDEVYEGGSTPKKTDIYRTMRIAAWNTDVISEEDAPTTWEEVLLDYPGQLIFDPGDWDWFAEVVKYHFMEDLGMSEEEAVEIFKESARGAVQVSGHTLGTQLMASGERGMTAVSYHHGVARLPDSAPVEWEPPVGPIFFDAVAAGIAKCAVSPASALLFFEFLVGAPGQQIMLDGGRTVANTNLGQGFPVEYEDMAQRVNMETLTTERDKWEALWEEVLRESATM